LTVPEITEEGRIAQTNCHGIITENWASIMLQPTLWSACWMMISNKIVLVT
jgi:hypothetical protein